MKENLLAAGEKYCVVMCSYQTLEYLKELTLVLGLDKPIAVSLVEGTGETIDEDESDKEEEGEPDWVQAAIRIVLNEMEVVS